MDEFFFDLQRFYDAGESFTLNNSTSGSPKTFSFSVTTGTTTVNYSVVVSGGGSTTVSTDTDGTVKFNVTKGTVSNFLNTDTGERENIIILNSNYKITAGESTPINGNGQTKTFSVTTGSTIVNYSVVVSGTATVSTDTDGTVKFDVTSGNIRDFFNTDTNTRDNIILLGGTVYNKEPNQPITLGENGPSFEYIWAGNNANDNYVVITLTKNTDYYEVGITPINSARNIDNFRIGNFSYVPDKGKSLSARIKIEDGRTYIDVSTSNSSDTIKYGTQTYSPVSGTVTLAVDKDGSNFCVTGLDKGDRFSVDGVTYKKTKVRFEMTTSSGEELYWTQGVVPDEILVSEVINEANYAPRYIATDGKIVISKESGKNKLLNAMGSYNSIALFGKLDSSDDDNSASYGSLDRTKIGDVEYFTLKGVSLYNDDGTINEYNQKYVSVEVQDGLNVSFNAEVCGVPITVYGTTFASTDSLNAFTYTSVTGGAVSVNGATTVSLLSGALYTKGDLTQTIEADKYSISGYSGGSNGIHISRADSLSSIVAVGDLDVGEQFTDGTSNYTMTASGLLAENSGNYSLYRDAHENIPAQVTLGSGVLPLIEPDSSKILEIGTTNTRGLVFNSKTNPTLGYAEISSSSGSAYSLNTLSGDDVGVFSNVISTISLTGGETTINKSLVLNDVTITTTTGTTFIVTDSADNFSVSSGTTNNPKITGATALTLLGGAITASAGQKIKLGTSGKELELLSGSADMTIAYDSTASTFTVTAPATTSGNGNFSFDGKTYKIDQGNGMTFTIDSSDIVTIGDFDSGDVLIYDSTAYSVKAAGLFKGTSPYYIWDKNNSHLLSNNSVVASDLSGNYWQALALVDNLNNITLSPNDSLAGVLVDENFTKTYGKISNDSNGHSISSNAEDKGTLATIFIDSGTTPYTLNATGSNLLQNVTIDAPNADLSVTEAISDNDSYQVVLDDSGNTALVGAKKASLFNGSLTADSNISSGVIVDGYTVIPGEVVTLETDSTGANASVGGLSYDEKFNVNSDDYTFTAAGLRKDNQILRGSKTNSSVDNKIPLASVTSTSGWLGLLGVDSISGVSITSASTNALLVDTFGANVQPKKLYGELTAGSNGYSLSNDGTYDDWENNYTINVDATTVTLTSGFKGASVAGSQSGAAFRVSSLQSGATSFTVTDQTSGGASLSGVAAISQTGGLVAADASKIQSVTAGGTTVYNNSGLPLNVNASGSNATLEALDLNDTFLIGSTEYSVKSLGLMTDTQFLKSSSITGFNSAVLSEVADLTSNDWIYIASVKDNLFSIPPETGSNSWIVLDETRSTRYAQMTGSGNGYSIVKDTNDWPSNDTIQVTGGNTLSLTSDFRNVNISVESSGAVFSVSDNDSYSVTDAATGGASIGNAKTINQTAGTIALSLSDQSILAGGHSVSGAGDTVSVVVTGSNASVGALDSGEKFNADGTTYTLLNNGRLQRDDKSIWNGDLIATTNGSVALDKLGDNTWRGEITTDKNGNLTLNSAATNVLQSISSAFIVNTSDATSIYGTLTENSGTYALNATDRNSTLRTVTFTQDIPVSLTSDFTNVSLRAGSSRFTATNATGGFTVNYDSSGLVVNTAAVVSLTSGNIILDSVNSSQTIVANNQSVSSASESINVKRSGSNVTVDGFNTANESVDVNANTYSFIEGDGFSVKISGENTTTVEDLNEGDQFKIDDETFIYTTAGLTKTAKGSSTISYLLKDIRPENNKMSLEDLQSTSDDVWLGVWSVSGGEVVISTEIPNSVVLVDDVTNPTKNYGQVTRDDSGNYDYIKYDGDASAIAGAFEEPTSITVQEGANVSISSDFSNKPVKAVNAASITVTDSGETNYVLGGTVDNFVPFTMMFTPATGDNFSLESVAYEMTGVGLTKPNDNEIWTAEGVRRYILPDDEPETWSNLIKLTADNVLDLSNVSVEGGNNVIVDADSTNRWATLNYTTDSSTHELNSVDGNVIPSIQTADGTATFTTDFATTFKTGDGTYTINEKTYTGNDLEISATAETSTLQNGTVTITQDAQAVTPTDDKELSVTAGELTATAQNGKWSSLGNLTDGDTFTVDGTTYKVFGDANLAKVNSSGQPEKLYRNFISGGKLNYSDITGDDYIDVVKLNKNDQLDLTKNLGITSALVVGQTGGNFDPTNRIAQLDYADDVYTLSQTPQGTVANMDAVLLGTKNKIFNTALDTTVKTKGTDTFTINGKDFNAENALTVVTENNDAILTNGKVSLDKDELVTTRYNDGSNHDEIITSTEGAFTVTANNSANTVTISELDTGDAFTVGSNSYTMTSIGLVSDDNLNCDVAKAGSITTADLTAGDWKAIVPAPDEILTLNSSVPANAFVANVDTDNPSSAVKFGTLSKADDAYTLTQAKSDSKLAGVILDNVVATLPTTCTNTDITAQGATFSVTASKAFTIDATSTALPMTNVKAINLTAGTIQATNDIPITADGNVITTTSGTMTVGIDDDGVFVGGLNEGETFKVGDTTYEMTSSGLLDTTNQQIATQVTDTYYIGDEFTRIIAADGSTLDLSNETTDAEVYDSVTNPVTHMASLTVDDDGALTLNNADGGIDTINLAKDATLTVDFASTVNSSGETTVNSVTYDGTSNLIIDATPTTSTLQKGTITLESGESIKATNDDTPLEVTNGKLNAKADDGKFTDLSGLNVGESFTFGGKDYTQSAVGLVNGSLISLELAGKTLKLSKLTDTTWNKFIAPQGGVLNVTEETEDALVLDKATLPTKKLGDLAVEGSNFNLEGTEDAQEIEAVTLPENATLDVDFATKAIAPSGAVQVNGKNYNASGEVIFDSDGETSTLYDGTVILDDTNPTVTATDDSTLSVESGSITATAQEGELVTVGNANPQESFTLDGTTYYHTAVGLMKDDKLNEKLAGETLSVPAIRAGVWKNIILPDGENLNLSGVTEDALICDDEENPTIIYATLDANGNKLTLKDKTDAADTIKHIDVDSGTDLTVNFVSQVFTSGFVTVNGNAYDGTGDLIIDTTEDSSTLTNGLVTLAEGASVTTTTGNTITALSGDGITVNADGDTVTIDGMTQQDWFQVDDDTYTVSSSGLVNMKGKLWIGAIDPSASLTLDDLAEPSNWLSMVKAEDGALVVNDETLEENDTSIVVNRFEDPTIVYGKLDKVDGDYILTKEVSDDLSSIEIDGVKIRIDNAIAGVPITINNADGTQTKLNVTADDKYDSFVVDATGDKPTVANTKALEISAGKLKMLDGQTVTVTDDAQDVELYAGNGTYTVDGEKFTIAKLSDGTLLKFSFDTEGEASSISGFEKDSTVTIEGATYTAPADDAVLHYDDVDFWYFDGFEYDSYNVIVNANGTVVVDTGARFSAVIASGRTLTDNNSIKFAADISSSPVTVTNKNNSAITIIDADDETLTENFVKGNKATFSDKGVTADSLADVAGGSFKLKNNQTLVADDTTVTAKADDSTVGIGTDGNSLSMDKSAQIEAPADISLTLNAGDYTVNGARFTGNGTTSATTTTDGVQLDLINSDAINYRIMTLESGAGTATIDDSDNITVSGGAKVTNADREDLTVDGTAIIDDKTINTAEPTNVTSQANGFNVGTREVIVEGDEDGYTVNISDEDVSGLESIGSADGVTVEGLNNATVSTDKEGSFTTDDRTFLADSASVIYGFEDGELTSISGAQNIIGDFTSNVNVNGDDIQVTGDEAEEVTVSGTAKGVNKIETGAAGSYEVNGKTYEIEDDDTFAFSMSNGAVSGIESLENGALTISQDESGFKVNAQKVTLEGNTSPVTLDIVDSEIASVSGLDGTINGLENATVQSVTSATINGKLIDISGSDPLNAIVKDKVTTSLIGLTDGATVNSAPSMTITTAENGSFTFVDEEFSLEDTLDSSFDFLTNAASRVRGIDQFAGSLSGGISEGLTVNGEEVRLIGDGLIIETDGEKITNISGLEDGGEIAGDFGNATLNIPEGEVTINGVPFELEGDPDGANLSGNGSVISGLDKDATLGFGAAGVYNVDGETLTVNAGDSVTANRDGAYVINPLNPPISEKTEAEEILNRGENPVYVEPTESGQTSVDLTGDNDLALIDSPDATVTVQTGTGRDSVVVRHDAEVEVDLDENGHALIIPTAGRVTLENYNGDNAQVQTFDYSDIPGAIKSNDITFGSGAMTVGDAVIVYDADPKVTGATTTDLIDAQGRRQAVGFTHPAGGILDESTSDENFLMKGNYAENPDDRQKIGSSTILTGAGNDTILAGASDYIDAGGGENQIYLTDEILRKSSEGATIVLGDTGKNTVHNFSTGFAPSDDKILIKDLNALDFAQNATDLVMSADGAQITFDSPEGDSAYELKLTDGTNDYNAAIGKADSVLSVNDDSAADIFFGNDNGISFSEYTGAVEVNLNEGNGSLNGRAVQFRGLNKAEAGAGDTSLIGAAGTNNTLTGGTGNSSIWSNSGRDLMVGNTDENKTGSTTFFYQPGDGRDSITNFDFLADTKDITSDKILLDDNSGVTSVMLRGDDVVIGINNSADDYLTLAEAKGKSFRFNDDLIAKVDTDVEYDGFTNCYVGYGNTATLTVAEDLGDVAIWLSDDSLEYHGIMYDGNFGVLDASAATGNATLAGNELNNSIIGGAGNNSIWGGYSSSNDTLVGGAGKNTFFFALENGHDVIQNAHDGDVVSLEDIYYDNIARADITDGGAFIELTDGSTLEVRSTANVDYRLADGSTYAANRTNREWVQK